MSLPTCSFSSATWNSLQSSRSVPHRSRRKYVASGPSLSRASWIFPSRVTRSFIAIDSTTSSLRQGCRPGRHARWRAVRTGPAQAYRRLSSHCRHTRGFAKPLLLCAISDSRRGGHGVELRGHAGRIGSPCTMRDWEVARARPPGRWGEARYWSTLVLGASVEVRNGSQDRRSGGR